MTEKILKQLLSNGESESIEFKTSFDKDAIETLSTFVFKEAGIIEKYGSGIKRVLEAFQGYGLAQPIFEEIQNGFKVAVSKTTQKTT